MSLVLPHPPQAGSQPLQGQLNPAPSLSLSLPPGESGNNAPSASGASPSSLKELAAGGSPTSATTSGSPAAAAAAAARAASPSPVDALRASSPAPVPPPQLAPAAPLHGLSLPVPGQLQASIQQAVALGRVASPAPGIPRGPSPAPPGAAGSASPGLPPPPPLPSAPLTGPGFDGLPLGQHGSLPIPALPAGGLAPARAGPAPATSLPPPARTGSTASLPPPSDDAGVTDAMRSMAWDDTYFPFAARADSVQTVKCCSKCGATRTPQWREGPCGPKTLCNACGVKRTRKLRAEAEAGAKRRRADAAARGEADALNGDGDLYAHPSPSSGSRGGTGGARRPSSSVGDRAHGAVSAGGGDRSGAGDRAGTARRPPRRAAEEAAARTALYARTGRWAAEDGESEGGSHGTAHDRLPARPSSALGTHPPHLRRTPSSVAPSAASPAFGEEVAFTPLAAAAAARHGLAAFDTACYAAVNLMTMAAKQPPGRAASPAPGAKRTAQTPPRTPTPAGRPSEAIAAAVAASASQGGPATPEGGAVLMSAAVRASTPIKAEADQVLQLSPQGPTSLSPTVDVRLALVDGRVVAELGVLPGSPLVPGVRASTPVPAASVGMGQRSARPAGSTPAPPPSEQLHEPDAAALAPARLVEIMQAKEEVEARVAAARDASAEVATLAAALAEKQAAALAAREAAAQATHRLQSILEDLGAGQELATR